MTIRFIDGHRCRFPVAAMCRTLGFSERTYYAAKVRAPSNRTVADGGWKTVIHREWTANYSCYGPNRLWGHLGRQGHQIGRDHVGRLMGELGIHGVQRGKRQFTTHPDKDHGRAPDLVKRQSTADRPNDLWVADITYCSTWEGWLYVVHP